MKNGKNLTKKQKIYLQTKNLKTHLHKWKYYIRQLEE